MSAARSAGPPTVSAGPALAEARGLGILVHGRGADARSMLELARALDVAGLAWRAPQAPGGSWYPASFLAPRAANEPGRSRGLARLETLIEEGAAALGAERVALIGFSQGACLAAECMARAERPPGLLLAFTGGLIGAEDEVLTVSEAEARVVARGAPPLRGARALLSAGDPDPHVPWPRVEATRRVLEALGAEVLAQRQPGLGHTISEQGLEEGRRLLRELVAS